MNILIVTQYFWPEPFIINDLVLKIKEQGHTVTVFTGKPNYPDGDVYSGYTRTGIQEEIYADEIPVYRIPLRPRNKGGGKNLILNYLSFVFSGIRHAFRFSKNKKVDMIFVFAISPITAAIPAILIKWLTKSHLTIWVQDLWPESVLATGFIKNPFLLRCVGALVKGIYYFSDTLLAQSKAFIPHISRLAPEHKVAYYPNSVIDNFNNKEVSTSVSADLIGELDSCFCVVFAGNIGTAQAVETIVAAAKQLKHLLDLKFVLVGSGSKSEWVRQQVREHQIDNLILAGRYPVSEMPFIFSKAAALLVTLKRDDIFSYTIPSKVQSYLAAGKPIIAALDGAGAGIIDEAGAGLTGPAEDVEQLVNNIKTLYHLPPEKRNEMGLAGRSYFLDHFEMENQSRRLIEIFENRLGKKEYSR